jgi:hypothetical protein
MKLRAWIRKLVKYLEAKILSHFDKQVNLSTMGPSLYEFMNFLSS